MKMSDLNSVDPSSEEKNSDILPQFEDEMDSNPPPPPSSQTPPPLPPGATGHSSMDSQTPPPLPPGATGHSSMDSQPAASEEMSEEAIEMSRQLETLVMGVAQDDTNSLAGTELEIGEARRFLHSHNLRRALTSVKNAEASLIELEEDVLHLRRNIAMLHRLLNEKKVSERDIETILLRLRSATGAAEMGDVGGAAGEVEFLVDDLIGGNTSTLNPFLFRHFWMGLETRDRKSVV
jgi:hypothetical protein